MNVRTPDRATTWRRLPGSRRLVVHADSGRSAAGIRALAGTSDWRRRLADVAGTAAVRVLGAGGLPLADPLPWPEVTADELGQLLHAELPGLRLLGAAVPRQDGRPRLSVLAHLTGNRIVLKLGEHTGLRREATALCLLASDPLPGIATPDVVAAGSIGLADGHIGYLATTAIAVHGQRAAIDAPLRTFEADLGARLADLPRDDGDAPDLVPVHGDLTPWNLRRTDRGLALFDWESAGWAAPGTDVATYRAACDEIRPWWRRPPVEDARP